MFEKKNSFLVETHSSKIFIVIHAEKKKELKKEYILKKLPTTRLSVIIAVHITLDYKMIICGLFKKDQTQ